MVRISQILLTIIFLTSCAKEDKVELYWETGSVKETGIMINGLKDGTWITFNEQGDTTQILNFKNDTLEGPVYYFEDGIRSVRSTFKDGLGHGLYERYFSDGTLLSRGYKEFGKHQGKWIIYHKNGQTHQEAEFENNEIIKSAEYASDGQAILIMDKKARTVTTFDSLGNALVTPLPDENSEAPDYKR